jgi:hypothetical protein
MPITEARKGKLKTPVPKALAKNAKIDPRSEPYFNGLNHLSSNDFG